MSARIGVLTSGGDAPGMNAAIASVAEHGQAAGLELVGFRRGYLGVSVGDQRLITVEDAQSHARQAGTWLQSSRYPRMRCSDGLGAVVERLRFADLAGLVVIGGDGSLNGARRLAEAGICVAFLPATIDNDIRDTDTTLGHHSAVSYAAQVIGQLRLTGSALPGRAFVVQTLGGSSHRLAQAVARASAITDVLVGGGEEEIARIAASLRERSADGEAIAVMPEAIGNAVDVARRLQDAGGVRVHPTILGHAQRAAPITEVDLALASAAGGEAVAAVLRGEPALITFDPSGRSSLRPIDHTTAAVPPAQEGVTQ